MPNLPDLHAAASRSAGFAYLPLAVKGWGASLALHLGAFIVATCTEVLHEQPTFAVRSGPISIEAAFSPAWDGQFDDVTLSEILERWDDAHQPETPGHLLAAADLQHAEFQLQPHPISVEAIALDEPPKDSTPQMPALAESADASLDASLSSQPKSAPSTGNLVAIDSAATNQSTALSAESDSSSPSAESHGNDGDAPPQLVENTPIPYPPDAVRNRLDGSLLLRLHIDAVGRVVKVEVVKSSGHASLDRAAANAVRDWRAAPARRQGRAVAATAIIPIKFLLN